MDFLAKATGDFSNKVQRRVVGAAFKGFSLSIPNITRKTEKQLPKYDGSDTFILSNAEDLVEVGRKSSDDGKYSITQYQPRVEGLFARIEYWEGSDDAY